jgi:hypothetical protein
LSCFCSPSRLSLILMFSSATTVAVWKVIAGVRTNFWLCYLTATCSFLTWNRWVARAFR